MGYLGHCAAESGAPAPDSLDGYAGRKPQGVNFSEQSVRAPVSGGVHTDKDSGRIDMIKRLMPGSYVGDEAFEFCCQVESCHACKRQRGATASLTAISFVYGRTGSALELRPASQDVSRET